MSLNDHIHSVYSGNIKDSKPIRLNRLGHTLMEIMRPDPKTIELNIAIRNCTDKAKKDELKTHLNSYTPAVVCHGARRYENIVAFSGLMSLDFDKLPDVDYSKDFRKFLFNSAEYIIATWLSSSGLGVRALVHIPIAKDVDEYKLYFAGIEKIYGRYIGFDRAPKNAVLPLFQSYDPDMLLRTEYDTFKQKYIEPELPPKPVMPRRVNSNDEQRVVNIVTAGINKITDNGHPQLRAVAYALGGYVAADYIGYYDAIDLINDLIDSNNYLNTKPKVYKITARTMITKGQSQPLYL